VLNFRHHHRELCFADVRVRALDDPSPFAVSGAEDAVAFVDKKGNLMVRDLAFARCPQKQR
jgi:hypothetical protein